MDRSRSGSLAKESSIVMLPERSFWKEVGRTKKDYSILDGRVSSLPDGGRHREAHALPLSRMARSKAGNSGVLQNVGVKGKNVEERMEVTKMYRCASSQ